MPLEAGKPFEMEAERTSLKALYATGRYAQIRTDTTPAADGLRVDFVVEKNLFNNVLRIEGLKEPPTEASALAALRMPLGEPFRESVLAERIEALAAIRCRTRGSINRTSGYALEPHQGNAADGRERAHHAGAASAHRDDHGGESQLAFREGYLEPVEAEDEAGSDFGAAHQSQRPAAEEICGRWISRRERNREARRVRREGEPRCR